MQCLLEWLHYDLCRQGRRGPGGKHMESMRSVQSTGSGTAVRTALAKPSEPARTSVTSATRPQARISPTPKRVGYGLPCAKCRKYYSAALSECPVCKSTERLMPA